MTYTPLQFEVFPARADQMAGNQTPGGISRGYCEK
jgi:hypothetical protein